jgi:beta-N-acetylhexosaminidase
MSRTIIHDLLKLRFGFQGAVVSDDLEMKAIADNYGIGEAAVKSVLAGADLLLLCHKPEIQTEARDALAAAMMDGTIPIERCIDAADRVAAMKEKTRKRKIDPQCIGCEAHQRLAREIRELARG